MDVQKILLNCALYIANFLKIRDKEGRVIPVGFQFFFYRIHTAGRHNADIAINSTGVFDCHFRSHDIGLCHPLLDHYMGCCDDAVNAQP